MLGDPSGSLQFIAPVALIALAKTYGCKAPHGTLRDGLLSDRAM